MSLSVINTLELVILNINRYVCPVILILGVLGNILNLIIFTRQTFLKQSCSFYFLCISLTNIAMHCIGLTTRIIDEGFKLNLVYNNTNIFCKIRNYLVYTLFSISSWLFVLASLDRFFAINQSALKRQFYCSYKMAFKLTTLTIIICILIHIHMLIFFGYYYALNPYGVSKLTCTMTPILAYDIFYAFFILISYSLLPPFLMSIISLLTIKNFRQSRRKINSLTIFTLSKIMRTRRDTNQLIKVLSLQIFILILFTIPHSIYWLYFVFTSSYNSTKSNLRREYEKLALNIVRILLYINYGSSFYIQMIISKTCRQEFIKFLQKIFNH